jgi:hypothetical protein
MVIQKKQERKLFSHHYPSTDYTIQQAADHNISHHCNENLKSLQKNVQSKTDTPAHLDVPTVNKSSICTALDVLCTDIAGRLLTH